MDLIHPKANDYVDQYSNATPPVLKAMYEAILAEHPHAHLQSNWNQGGFLSFLSKMLQPKYIIEIGTFNGFSTLCLAEGLANGGQIDTIELREEDASRAKGYFEQYSNGKQINQHTGDAKMILPQLPHLYDLAFIDADKTGYVDYYTLLKPKMSTNGIIIADNTLFHGEVLEEKISGKNAKAIQAFNELVANDSETEKIMLTIRDGLTLIRKK
jgi:predicted O-methyltransferase YrrM